ncbi:MAG: MotA/TolQ/ExbB proton channel family protein [Thermogutta sp.]|uniref:motility protein A n=1 Tax=Thermogutta sp. TaxID=1962930 RepID=UPI0019B184E1|nr:MotA/TolQ/ExbB proton channel family protein [Thermogutta sp.]MBC7351101.1 MotA/TolQ/ExbB proton channel family protein [Thermogutta sp.]
MDIASVIGILGGFLLIVVSIAIAPGASAKAFIDYPSIMMVVGGAIAALLTSMPLRDVLKIGGVIKKVFFNKSDDVSALIQQIVSLAETARRDGLLALENRLPEISDPFIVLGVQMAVDGTRPEVMEDILRTEMDAVAARHQTGKLLFDQIGKFAPAFGMIGTLVGLIIMLGNMSDPNAIGPGMAVALLTTLYGAIVANVVALPMAEKLGHLSREEQIRMEIVVRGIMAIQAGENPRVIEQKLRTFVPPKARKQQDQKKAA